MKKNISIIIIFLFLISNVCLSFAENQGKIELTPQEYEHIANLGFSDKEILDMSEISLNLYKNIIANLVASDEVYLRITYKPTDYEIFTNNHSSQISSNLIPINNREYKELSIVEISKDQAISESNFYKQNLNVLSSSNGSTQTSWLRLTTDLSKIANKDEYFAKTSFEWLSNPLVDIGEVIGQGFSSNVSPVANSEYFELVYTRKDIKLDPNNPRNWYWGPAYTYTERIYVADKKANTGWGFSFRFAPTNSSGSNYRGHMSFKVKPNVSGAKIIDIYGSYVHTILSISPSITFSSSGILSITPGTAGSSMPNTHAQITVY